MDEGRAKKLAPSDRLVLLVLADRANGARFCWPSLPRIAGDTGLSARTVHTAVHRLAGAGLIRMELKGRLTHYHILRPADGEEPLQPLQGSNSHNATRPLQPLQPESCKSRVQTLATIASKPTKKEPLREPRARGRAQGEGFNSHLGKEGSKQAAAAERPPTPAEIEASRKRREADLAAMPPEVAAVLRRLGSAVRHVEHAPGRPPARTVSEQITAALENDGPLLHGEIIAPQPPLRSVAEQLAILRGERVPEMAQ